MEPNKTEKAIYFVPGSRSAERELTRCVQGVAILDDADREIAAIFATRGLRFEPVQASVVSIDEIHRREAEAIYNKKAKLHGLALIGPAFAASVLFLGVSFGWITAGFFRFLVAGCFTWAAATVWG